MQLTPALVATFACFATMVMALPPVVNVDVEMAKLSGDLVKRDCVTDCFNKDCQYGCTNPTPGGCNNGGW